MRRHLPATLSLATILIAWVVPAAARDGSTFLSAPKYALRVLFSPIAGLFPWSPVTALALLGLLPLCWRDGRLALSAGAIFVLQALVNGMVRDWWAGSGFGMRRMAELYPIYVTLLAALIGYLAIRRPRLAYFCLALTVACTLYAVALMLAHLSFTWTNPWGLARDTPLTVLYPAVWLTVSHERVRGLSSPWRADPIWHAGELWIEEGQ